MTNPVALSTTVWGDGSRRALLLHGLTSAGSTWWRIAEDLAELGYTALSRGRVENRIWTVQVDVDDDLEQAHNAAPDEPAARKEPKPAIGM